MNEPDGMTSAERMRQIDKMEALAGYGAHPHLLAHIARLRIIYKPFPAVRRVGTGSACPWGGCIVADTFYGSHGDGRGLGARKSGVGSDAGDRDYEGIYANAAE